MILHIIFKEIIHRKLNFLLSLAAIGTAVALYVGFFTTAEASKKETARLMRDLGYSLRIIANDTDMTEFYNRGYSEKTLPEESVAQFASQRGLSYAHLLGTIYQRINWRGREVILTGISNELSPPDRNKPSMIFTIEQGTVYLGYELGQSLGLKKGDEIEIQGETFKIVNCLNEKGNMDDIRIYGNLKDFQKLLNMEGKINEIQALDCACLDPGVDVLAKLRAELNQYIPGAKVVRARTMAETREKQRYMLEQYLAMILPFAAVVCAIWIGALAMLNARERRYEIGVLRALGYRSGKIAALFLGKAIVIGVVGAGIGFAVGTWLALTFGPQIFEVTAKGIRPLYSLLTWSLLAAPAFAAVSSFIPTTIAVTQDPAETLRDE